LLGVVASKLLDSELQLIPELVQSEEDIRKKDTAGGEMGRKIHLEIFFIV